MPLREPLIYQLLLLGLWDSGGRARLGRTNVRSGELFRSGIRQQEAADPSRVVLGRDGRGGAVAGEGIVLIILIATVLLLGIVFR
jgi:hypothetical protein